MRLRGGTPVKLPRPPAALRLSTVNDLALSNRRMEDEVGSLLQELNDAYATIERLRRRISARQMFGFDSEDEDSDEKLKPRKRALNRGLFILSRRMRMNAWLT
ncbi:hypothetical protein PI124_g19397 [Phytophthora idaei]|nr:hypothetical protein PI125_g20434 [Phytophthora idaei]KAG3134167.1 hypothetical protein PI126_g18820 [Phytophthora idaei]KAG3235572.1 hypothetical protein PI124_g19397 [Phytophthora idaei]